ncbi:MAG: 4-hydroxy-tetrahydrodipicolinate reductase [Gammaproteobacteria bacterium]|nr:4-hydroxy-tetrahydrodipicolinate reductase [Gammaproteobacteria bacterium]
MINVLINGAAGRMGQEAVNAVTADSRFALVAKTGRQDDLYTAIRQSQAHVVVDLTVASAAYQNTLTIIKSGAHPVIGTSGFIAGQIATLQTLCAEKKLGGIIVPNFSLGAVLMMKFAQQAAKYLPAVEIIERHHPAKQDAPSGTAIKTAQMIAAVRENTQLATPRKELLSGVRGGVCETIPIHSLRLSGSIAHQEVIFGGHQETLTIKHDSLHRACFMPGLLLACASVMQLNELIYGLDNVLD